MQQLLRQSKSSVMGPASRCNVRMMTQHRQHNNLRRFPSLQAANSSEMGERDAKDSTSGNQADSDWRSDSPRKRQRRRSPSRHTSHRTPHESRLRPSNKLRTHPSKEREIAWQEKHDRKAKSWQASTTSIEASIIEHPEQYFDEKWIHNQGRLSDFKASSIDEADKQNEERHGRHRQHRSINKEYRPHLETPTIPEYDSDPSKQSSDSTSAFLNSRSGNRLRFFATCHPGLEGPVSDELRSSVIGAEDVSPGASGVTFW